MGLSSDWIDAKKKLQLDKLPKSAQQRLAQYDFSTQLKDYDAAIRAQERDPAHDLVTTKALNARVKSTAQAALKPVAKFDIELSKIEAELLGDKPSKTTGTPDYGVKFKQGKQGFQAIWNTLDHDAK